MNPCKAFWISGLSRVRTLIGGCARVVRLIGGCALWSKTVVLGVVRGLCADFPQGSPLRRSTILIDAHYSVSLHTHPFKFYYHSELLPMISYSLLLPFTPYWRGLRGFQVGACHWVVRRVVRRVVCTSKACTTCTRVVRIFFERIFFR